MSISQADVVSAPNSDRAPRPMHADSSLADRLRVLSAHVQHLVEQRRSTDPDPDDPYRGLYVSDTEADVLGGERGERAIRSQWEPMHALAVPEKGTRLGDLAAAFGLDGLDLDLLIIAAGPDLEPRFEKLYGYLHDDLTRRRASIGLALELTGHGFADATARSRFAHDAALVRRGLVALDEPARSFLSRPLRVPDRVVAHLLGDDRMDPTLARTQVSAVVVGGGEAQRLAVALASGVSPLYLQDSGTGIGASIGASALVVGGLDALVFDLTVLPSEADPVPIVSAAIREARLRMCGLVITVDEHMADEHPEVMTRLADAGWPVIVVGPHPWDPAWSRAAVFSERAPRPDPVVVADVWRTCLPELEPEALREATRQLRLRPDQIVRSAELARRLALADARDVRVDDVTAAARAQNSTKLERLARRIGPAVVWGDLVLPQPVLQSLREIETRYRRRDEVLGDWGMGGRNNRRLGVVSLFAGPSGVGKTMAAEALAAALGLDLYQVNLATVVDKYIGETEKNLERIFSAAEGVNAVIFFDEADALFGKRSEVNDARDRYANVEVAYLLQRLETYEGVAVLATNLRSNIDDAFTRRLDVVVDFPEPDETLRRRLWDACLGDVVERSRDVDLDFLAGRFQLAGGNIRNIAVSAAFLASARGDAVTMLDLVRSTSMEYRKLGRLCTAYEFGAWHSALGAATEAPGPGRPDG